MKPVQFITGVLRLLLLAILVGALFGANFIGILTIAAIILVASCIIPMPKGAAFDIYMEVWANYIMERFWKDNAFLRNAYDDSSFVVGGRIIHIPQPGAKPNVVINRNQFPGVSVRRTDTDVLYALDEYSTDPTHIPNIESIQISYNKADSVLGDHMNVIDETVADNMLIKWASSASNTYVTTGAQIVNGQMTNIQVGPADGGQVGNRFAFTSRDLKNLMTKFNTSKTPKNDRYVLIDDNMYDGFYDSLGDTNAKDFSQYADAVNGVVGKLHSFNVMTRSSVLASDNTGAIKALGSAMAGTDNLMSLAWQKNTVAFAMGDKKLFQRLDDPLYYGDVHSALIMAGGRVRRGDGVGLWLIQQGAPQA